MRQNSLELSLGDLPKPAPFLRAAANAHPYPSPVSPSSRLAFVDKAPSCYFDPAHTAAADSSTGAAAAGSSTGAASTISRDDVALPPSPALVPLAFGHPESSWATLSAPRVEPSLTHPLHRAKRLSMTPLSSTKALPPVEDDDAPTADMADMIIDEPPKLRKSSIVDLPLPQGNGLPFTPPLTPPTVSAALGPARTSKVRLLSLSFVPATSLATDPSLLTRRSCLAAPASAVTASPFLDRPTTLADLPRSSRASHTIIIYLDPSPLHRRPSSSHPSRPNLAVLACWSLSASLERKPASHHLYPPIIVPRSPSFRVPTTPHHPAALRPHPASRSPVLYTLSSSAPFGHLSRVI